MVLKEKLSNNFVIIMLLVTSIIYYAYFYKKSITEFSVIFEEIRVSIQGVVTSQEINALDSLKNIASSMYFQIPLEFINSMLIVYILSVLIYITNRLETKFRKVDAQEKGYAHIVSCLYLSIYALILDYVIQGTIMMLTGSSMKTLTGFTPIIYGIVIWLLQGYLFLNFFYKRNKITFSPIIILTLFIICSVILQILIYQPI